MKKMKKKKGPWSPKGDEGKGPAGRIRSLLSEGSNTLLTDPAFQDTPLLDSGHHILNPPSPRPKGSRRAAGGCLMDVENT